MAFKPRCTKCNSWHWPSEGCVTPNHIDERGRFCSFNTVCGRNCTPRERDACRWWENAKDEVSHALCEAAREQNERKDEDGK